MNDRPGGSFLDRMIESLRSAWRDIVVSGVPRPGTCPAADAERLRAQMRACLEGRGGEGRIAASPAIKKLAKG